MDLKYHASDVDERARIAAWHATFNAYIQGLSVKHLSIYDVDKQNLVAHGVALADLVHGSIAAK